MRNGSVLGPVFTVTNTNDSGPGSLREAITNANRSPNGADPERIVFDIPGLGPHTIRPLSPLPLITDPVVIDGTTQRGYLQTPMVELDGSLAGPWVDGLVITSGGSTIRGLVINRFQRDGIFLTTHGGNVVEGCYVGTDLTGRVAAGNGWMGIEIANGSGGNRIGTNGDGVADEWERNVISGNLMYGIQLAGTGTDANVVAGNYIGVDATGRSGLGNGNGYDWGCGVVVFYGATANRIGTDGNGVADQAERNIISANSSQGLAIWGQGADRNVVAGNLIGVGVTGTIALGNGLGRGPTVLVFKLRDGSEVQSCGNGRERSS